MYDATCACEALVKFITSAKLPLSFTDDNAFKEFIQVTLCLQYKKISRNITRSDCIKVFFTMRQSLIEKFKSFNAIVSYTSDLWESCNKAGCLFVTAHYVDEDWVLQK